jgi:hypothetical protein
MWSFFVTTTNYSKKNKLRSLMNPSEAINNSIEKPDLVSSTKTMYDVSTSEIFIKNFIAGAGRAMGSIILYLLFFGIIAGIFTTYIWPYVQPFVAEYQEALQGINSLTKTTQPGQTEEYQRFLQDLDSSFPRINQ